LLTNETNEDSIDGNPSSTKIQKTSSNTRTIHGVINYGEMIKRIRDTAKDKQYCTKSLANNVSKINCVTPETYRKRVKYFKENNIFYHTYQLKEERA
jgi:dihydroneopterin aldolase